MRLHHVQVTCPPGAEDDARRFYGEGLGMAEVDKPAELAKRGGAWFRAYDGDGVSAEVDGHGNRVEVLTPVER